MYRYDDHDRQLVRERVVNGTVAGLPKLIEENAIRGPAVILIGAVAALPLQQPELHGTAIAS